MSRLVIVSLAQKQYSSSYFITTPQNEAKFAFLHLKAICSYYYGLCETEPYCKKCMEKRFRTRWGDGQSTQLVWNLCRQKCGQQRVRIVWKLIRAFTWMTIYYQHACVHRTFFKLITVKNVLCMTSIQSTRKSAQFLRAPSIWLFGCARLHWAQSKARKVN